MKRTILSLFLVVIALPLAAQYGNPAQPDIRIPDGLIRRGFYYQKSVTAQMDGDPALEEVFLIGHDAGHWPEFDLFKFYYAVVDRATGAIEYTSEEYLSDRFNLLVDDRDRDGVSEIHFQYIKDGAFTTAADGYEPAWTYDYGMISLIGASGKEPMPAARIRTLIIAGMDGSHYPAGSAECMRQALENSGHFDVDVLMTPDWGGDMSSFHPRFKDYSLVIINYGGVEWADPVKADFESYVSDGGGVVFIHSSIIPMEKWPAWNRMTGLGAWNGRNEVYGPYVYMQDGKVIRDDTPGEAGYHGLQHHVVVDHQALDHPIVKGLPKSWHHFKDEIYMHLRGPAENLEIIATTRDGDRDEPLMWTVRYGKGRIFVDVLGHCGNDPKMTYAMTCTGYQTTLLRGCEWAATGTVTLPLPVDFPDQVRSTLRPEFKLPERVGR